MGGTWRAGTRVRHSSGPFPFFKNLTAHGIRVKKAAAMERAKHLLCTLKHLRTMALLRAHGTAGLVARPNSFSSGRAVEASNSVRFGDLRAPGSGFLKSRVSLGVGSVRFMGIGSFKEANRAGQHGVGQLQAKSDGSAEKFEQDRREEFLDKAKQESASRLDEAQEPFRGSVESGQSIGEATTELEFAANDGKSAEEDIDNASQELFRQSNVIGEEDKKYIVKDHGAENHQVEVASEVWGAKEQDGTSPFLDDSDKVDFRGEEKESVLGIGGRRAEDLGAGETT